MKLRELTVPIAPAPGEAGRAAWGGVDFFRPVHAVLGLPVDAMTLSDAQSRVYAAVSARRRCFLSTPNLNFAVSSLDNREFRNSVINSDVSLADGMPLVWVARLFGMPIAERSAGSDLFARLRQGPSQALRVFLFGGAEGVAAGAGARLNAQAGGLRCVGSHAPGFGSVEDMSDDHTIGRINAAGADFLVVALGAGKGQSWIERNCHRLNVPVLSHLGAVMNFTAGTVRRAPAWMRRAGLEWLWRIREEPALFRRYARDGAVFLRLLAGRILPGALHQRLSRPDREAFAGAAAEVFSRGAAIRIVPRGAWHEGNLLRMRRLLEAAARRRVDLLVDLRDTLFVDSAFIGLMMLIHGRQQRVGLGLRIIGARPAVRRMFGSHCADYLLRSADGPGDASQTRSGPSEPSEPWRLRTT